jgi:hypothetical protein
MRIILIIINYLCGIAVAELRVISEKRAPADRKEGYASIRELYSRFFSAFLPVTAK